MSPTPIINLKQEVEHALQYFFPQLQPAELELAKHQVFKELSLVIEKNPTLEFNLQALRPHLENSIAHMVLDKRLTLALEHYTHHLDAQEYNELRANVKKDMEYMRSHGLNLLKNLKAHDMMMTLLIVKYCPKHKLNPQIDPLKEGLENIQKLKLECQRLINEMQKMDPDAAKEITKILQDMLREMNKKILDQGELNKELGMLLKMVITLSEEKLSPEQKVKIVAQGSDDGKYQRELKGVIPDNIVIYPRTPAAIQRKPPEPTPEK